MHHHHAESGAEEGVTTEDAGRRETDKYGQENEGRARQGVNHGSESCPLRVGFNDRFAFDDEVVRGEDVVKAHQ